MEPLRQHDCCSHSLIFLIKCLLGLVWSPELAVKPYLATQHSTTRVSTEIAARVMRRHVRLCLLLLPIYENLQFRVVS